MAKEHPRSGKTTAQRNKEARDKKRAAGLRPREIWATEEEHRAIQKLLAGSRTPGGKQFLDENAVLRARVKDLEMYIRAASEAHPDLNTEVARVIDDWRREDAKW